MAFGGSSSDDGEVMSEINMTPLVDVMLVLLIIFIITVPVLTHSVKVDLPQADNVPNEIQPDSVQLSITENGIIHWNDNQVTMDVLEQHLQAAAAQQPQPDIHLHGAKTVAYEHVVQVMSAAQRAGITKLGFVTEPASQ